MSLWDSIKSGASGALDSAFASAAPVTSNLLTVVSQSASSVGRVLSDKASGAWDSVKAAGSDVLGGVGSLADAGYRIDTLDPKSIPAGPGPAPSAKSAKSAAPVLLALAALGGLWFLTRKKG